MAAPDVINLNDLPGPPPARSGAPDVIPIASLSASRNVSPAAQIDYTRDLPSVRADIAKLPSQYHDEAVSLLGEHRAKGDIQRLGSFPSPRVPVVAPIGDQIGAAIEGGVNYLTGNKSGATYEESLATQRARTRQQREEHPVSGLVGDMLAGSVLPVPGAAASVGGRIAQTAGLGAGLAGGDALINTPGSLVKKGEAALSHGLIGAGVGGALGAATEGVGAVLTAAMRQGVTGAAAHLAESLPVTVDEFANQVATGAGRSNAATQRRTLDILGEEMNRAGGDRNVAVPAAVTRIQNEVDVTPQTAATHIRNLTNVHADSPLMLGEYPAVAQSNQALRGQSGGNVPASRVNLDALGRVDETPTQGIVDYLANAGNTQSSANVRNALTQRQETLAPQMAEELQQLAPRVGQGRAARPATIEDTANMADAARQAGSLAYGIAHQAPLAIPAQDLQQGLEALVQHHAARANSRSGEVGDQIINGLREFFERDPMTKAILRDANGRPQIIDVTGPTGLQRLQDARSAIGAVIRKAVRDGDNNIVAALQPMYRDTRPNLATGAAHPDVTALMTRASPQWAVANRHWGTMEFEQMAADLGDAFAKRAGPQFRAQLEQFQSMAPQAQNIVRVHFLQQLLDRLDNLGDAHTVSKLFANDHSRNAIRALFGDEAAVAFTRAVRDQKAAEISQAATKNSRTHMRGQVQRQMDGDTGILAAAENASARGVKNWLMERVTQLLTERRNRPLADMITTPMRDTAAVAHRIAQMRAAQARIARATRPTNAGVRASMALSAPFADAIAPPKRGMALTRP